MAYLDIVLIFTVPRQITYIFIDTTFCLVTSLGLTFFCPYFGLCGVIYYLPLRMESQSEAQGIFIVSQVFAHKLKSNYS